MKTAPLPIAIGMGVVCWLAAVADAQGLPASEKQKIEALIKHVEELKDAKFVRNGVEYDAKTAGAFLRGKWEANAAAIKTAQDFVDKAATTSSTTGQPYLIRFKDGKETKSGEHLRAELMKLSPSAGARRSGDLPQPGHALFRING
jgi:hypothetical protein